MSHEKKVEFVDLVKRFPTVLRLLNLVSIQPRTERFKSGSGFRYSRERTVQSLGAKNGSRIYSIPVFRSQTLNGPFSAVSKPNLATEAPLERAWRDLQFPHSSRELNFQKFQKVKKNKNKNCWKIQLWKLAYEKNVKFVDLVKQFPTVLRLLNLVSI